MPDIHIPHLRQTGAEGECWRSQENPLRVSHRGIRIGTPGFNDRVPSTENPGGDHERRPGKAPMYEEMAESTHLRALCIPPPGKNEAGKEMLKSSDVKRLIKEVMEQKQIIAMPMETPMKGFPLSEELQRQPMQPGFKLPQLFVYLGKEDLDRHLQHFIAMAVLHGWNEVTRCKAFPLSLAGQAQQWFTELLAGHIRSFE